ncbi:MAG: hypothetical protein KBS60_02475, partial [Phascolarctobacterium sp.]|nr:hypothetical protein [Candidatus Phascolarctobacterium caballi]
MKKHLLRKILLNVVMGGALLLPNLPATGVEAADFKYKVDDGPEQTWDGSADLRGTGSKLEVWGEGAVSSNMIYGGYDSGPIIISGKTVVFKNGEVVRVYGGYSWDDGDAIENTVTISGGSVGVVYGGYSWDGNITENAVSISGGSVGRDVCGGRSTYGNVTENAVSISGGSVGGDVYGGNSDYGDATENTVTVSGGSVEGYIYGGKSYSDADIDADITGNIVNISGGSVNGVYGGNSSNGNVTENAVNISGGTAGGEVSAGFSWYGDATGNTVTISGGMVNTVYGGRSIYGNVTENTVSISGGSVGWDVYGGSSEWGGKVNGNTVIISDGTVGEYVSGGFSYGGEVSGNKVIISGGDLSNAEVYGYGGSPSSHSNNTLQINNPVTIKKVAKFDIIDLCNTGSVTIKDLTVERSSILKVDGRKITSAAAISGLTSATVKSGAKLYVSNAVKNTEYKILAGSGLNVQSWTDDSTMGDGFRASYGLLVDTDNIVNNGSEFSIRFKEDPLATSNLDIRNIVTNLPAESKAKEWLDAVSVNQSGTDALKNTINTMANVS